MSLAHDSKFSFLASRNKRGTGRESAEGSVALPPRSQSLPELGVPAGFSNNLGNRLGLEGYANLRGPYNARRDLQHFPNGGRYRDPPARSRALDLEESLFKEKLRPEAVPPAGNKIERKEGKRRISANTNYISHADTLIWGADFDGSDGLLRLTTSPVFAGRAGVNTRAEREPLYGHLPPVCRRTFGPDGPTLVAGPA
mmetsp:Transcript_88850/g.176681  ORF Transcript_88850/g.176681 Transcript_88850/m.176681 type:complete len:198 (+) Transcript_88850:77-670(+)|eukprot:CAMPEP_0172884942 /NCGR_PEP_ID=MMETSP1075-20121228/126562_1 /TAXON_ID=2916 /ORGANISM="Ceratium fusus, Strain PA161109" /LENGTH=197 /DNA_ID=CAMNT_0013738125 /DNA_START=5 /DNA_END=598 /DNA_ORIENTATION=+